MSKKYEFIAKTADEAIDKALEELKCSLSDLDIDIQEYKQSGFFSFLKPKEIKIIATFKEEYLREKEKEKQRETLSKAKSNEAFEKTQKPQKSESATEVKPEVRPEAKPEKKAQSKVEKKESSKENRARENNVRKEAKEVRETREHKEETEVQTPKSKSQENTEEVEKKERIEKKNDKKEIKSVEKKSEFVDNSEEIFDGDFENDFVKDDKTPRKSVEITELTQEERTKIKDLAYEFIMDLMDSMKIDAEITLVEKRQQLLVLLNISEGKQLIGYRGETLFAIQYLLSVYMNYKMDKYLRIKLDINNYRRKKEMELKRRVMSVARKVEKTNKAIKLEEMHASDRHFIHMQLKRNKRVYTKSEGVEPNRCVVILPVEKTE